MNFPTDRDRLPAASAACGPAEPAHARQESPAAAFELAPLGHSASGAPVRLFRFPGKGDGTVLILGGVHGSEASGVEIAWRVVDRLAAGFVPGPAVYAVPCLFPDNRAAGLREGAVPTNRNFPAPGESLASASERAVRLGLADGPADSLGIAILPENRMLIALIGRIKPRLAVSLHATVHPERAGIFADPHTVPDRACPPDAPGRDARLAEAAARTTADAALALAMARHAAARGARVAGNRLAGEPTALWAGETPQGTSLGGWAPAPIVEGGAEDRPAIGLITVEADGLADSRQAADSAARAAELAAIADCVIALCLAP